MKKRTFSRTVMLGLQVALLASLAACSSAPVQPVETEAGEPPISVPALPVLEDFPIGSDWDGQQAPTRENGPWSQAYGVFAALEAEAARYGDVKAQRSFSLACHDPVGSGPGELATAWANAVTVASQGKLKVNVGYSGTLSAATTSLDDMKQGTIDFDWTLPCYFKGYMPLTNVIQNPALGIPDGAAGSRAMWELYQSESALQAEAADDGVLLFVCTNCTSPISYNGTAEVQNIHDIAGNIRANNGPAQLFVEQAGATVFGCPIGDVYSNVQHGIINYLITDWNGIDSFALSDPGVLNYYIDTNVGCSAFALLANTDVWNSIDSDMQEIILSVSGDYMLNLVDIWNYWEASGRYNALEKGGVIYAPAESFATELSQTYDRVAEAWIAQQSDPEIARQIYDHARELVETTRMS